MKTWSESSRRTLASLSAVALCAVLALSISVAGATAGNPKCVKGAEAAGCALPAEATFDKKLKGSGDVSVQVSDKGFSFSAYAAPVKCTKFAPALGPEQQLAVGLSAKRHPKVG